MTPKDYFSEVAIPTVEEFRSSPRDRRLAYLASVAVFHIVDHVAKAREVSKSSIEKHINTEAMDSFRVVRGVCSATKHVSDDDPRGIGFVAGSEVDRPPAQWGKAVWGISRWDDSTGGIDIPSAIGHHHLLSSLDTCMAAFKRNFPELN